MRLEDDKLAFCLGDVSGKGLPASLLMANLQATLRGQTLVDVPASETVRRSNQLLFRSTDPEKFATLFYGILNFENHRIQFSNAGHENPYLLSPANDPVRLACGGTVLGVVDNFPFEEDSVEIKPGDTLVVFSDGITEAFDPSDNQFGEEKLVETIAANRDQPARIITERIIDSVRQFAATAPQADDLTLVVMKRES